MFSRLTIFRVFIGGGKWFSYYNISCISSYFQIRGIIKFDSRSNDSVNNITRVV